MSNHIHFDDCPVVIADDDTACIHRINTPGTYFCDSAHRMLHIISYYINQLLHAVTSAMVAHFCKH